MNGQRVRKGPEEMNMKKDRSTNVASLINKKIDRKLDRKRWCVKIDRDIDRERKRWYVKIDRDIETDGHK